MVGRGARGRAGPGGGTPAARAEVGARAVRCFMLLAAVFACMSPGDSGDTGDTVHTGDTGEAPSFLPTADLVFTTVAGGVYRWGAGDDAPSLLTTLPSAELAHRGAEGALDVFSAPATWSVVDPATGAIRFTVPLTTPGDQLVDCGGLAWFVADGEVHAHDGAGVVWTVPLDPLEDDDLGALTPGLLVAHDQRVHLEYTRAAEAVGNWIVPIECATGALGEGLPVEPTDRLLVDHGTLVGIARDEAASMGGVYALDLASGDRIGVWWGAAVLAWAGRPGEVQVARVLFEGVPEIQFVVGNGPGVTGPDLPLGTPEDNLVLLFDGDEPTQAWAIGPDGMLAAFALLPEGETWRFDPRPVDAWGPISFLDTAEP